MNVHDQRNECSDDECCDDVDIENRICCGCGRIMSEREFSEQRMCNDCNQLP